MSYVIDAGERPSLQTTGGGLFPVRRIWCVGRNYAEHAREMGHSGREAPFFFAKPWGAATMAAEVPYPPGTAELHHEVELVVALGGGGSAVSPDDVPGLIWGATVGVDLTRRDVQAEAKKKGRPWDMAKGFDHSAPIAPLRPIGECGPIDRGRIALSVNGETRQDADLSEMIWSVAEHMAELSKMVELAPGDLVMTGTPAGVGAVSRGDTVECSVERIAEHSFRVV